jgi:hypothetical protein
LLNFPKFNFLDKDDSKKKIGKKKEYTVKPLPPIEKIVLAPEKEYKKLISG